jgi:hypothetical protein
MPACKCRPQARQQARHPDQRACTDIYAARLPPGGRGEPAAVRPRQRQGAHLVLLLRPHGREGGAGPGAAKGARPGASIPAASFPAHARPGEQRGPHPPFSLPAATPDPLPVVNQSQVRSGRWIAPARARCARLARGRVCWPARGLVWGHWGGARAPQAPHRPAATTKCGARGGPGIRARGGACTAQRTARGVMVAERGPGRPDGAPLALGRARLAQRPAPVPGRPPGRPHGAACDGCQHQLQLRSPAGAPPVFGSCQRPPPSAHSRACARALGCCRHLPPPALPPPRRPALPRLRVEDS